MGRFRVLFYIIILSCSVAFARQSDGIKKEKAAILKKAEIAFDFSDFTHALPLYLKYDSLESGKPMIKYRIGQCYINSTTQKLEAIPYLEAASEAYSHPQSGKLGKVPAEVYYDLARSYHIAYRMDEAIVTFNKYKAFFAEDDYQFKMANRQIEMCNIAKTLVDNPVRVEITNLGSVINSSFPDYSPVITADETELLFTSRRPGSTGGLLTEDGEYFEDVYISYRKEDDEWTNPVGIDANINTTTHEATINISPGGDQLFIYKDDNGDGNIYSCDLDGDKWSTPKKLNSNINTKSWETHCSVTADGITLYFVSDKKGGYGGRDIYASKRLPNGEWGIARNLGPEINTEYDEDAPFIHPDGKTFIFSSSGHSSMGGFDIFTSTFTDGVWSTPENVGYPINTTDDDVFYVLSADGKHAYFSSFREQGFGEKDIYSISFPDNKKEYPLTLVKGVVSLEDDTTSDINATITINDNENNEFYGIYRPNKKTGKYLMILPPGKNYNIATESKGFLFHSENLHLENQATYYEVRNDVKLKSIQVGKSIILRNIFFDVDEHTLRPESKTEVDNLYKIMVDNPTIKIEISGHTDSDASDEYNLSLSERRAKVVVMELVNRGIEQSRMTWKGYGERRPIDTNATPEGKQNNRRTEFMITEF